MIDRSKYRATEVNTLVAQEKEQEQKSPFKGGGEYHKFADGDNKFRIYPAHPNHKSFTEFRSVNFLPFEYEKDKNGQKVKEIGRKPFVSAIYHSKIMTKDVVNEYFKFVNKYIKESVNEREFKRIFNQMTKGDGDKDKGGIKSQDSWVVYADKYLGLTGKDKVFGILELKKSMKTGMNAIMAEHAKGGGIDPFTGVDTGVAVIITKDKVAGEKNANDWYRVKLESQFEEVPGRGKMQYFPATPLTDEDLEKFEKVEPLYEKYSNCYSIEDFIGQIEGLKRFDKMYNVNVFNFQEWNGILNDLSIEAEKLPSKEDHDDAPDDDEADLAGAPTPSTAPQVDFLGLPPVASPIQHQVQPHIVQQPIQTPQPIPTPIGAPLETYEDRIKRLREKSQKEKSGPQADTKDDLPF